MIETLMRPTTWEELVSLSPDLADVDYVLAASDRVPDRLWWDVYEHCKAILRWDVGLQATHAPAELQTAEAYEIGVAHVLERLGL